LINYITDLSVYRVQVRRKILIDHETEQERKACREGKENQVPMVSLLTARSATQRRGPEGAKRCVWHPRWLINRAASKLVPRQLRSYLYPPRGKDRSPIRPFKPFDSSGQIRGTTLKFLSVMIYVVTPAEIARAVWRDLFYTADPLLYDIINSVG